MTINQHAEDFNAVCELNTTVGDLDCIERQRRRSGLLYG
jgi:hypothetical protein